MFDLYDLRGGSIFVGLSVLTVATMLCIDPAELGWCIEEHGRCDVQDWCAVPSGTEIPMPIKGG